MQRINSDVIRVSLYAIEWHCRRVFDRSTAPDNAATRSDWNRFVNRGACISRWRQRSKALPGADSQTATDLEDPLVTLRPGDLRSTPSRGRGIAARTPDGPPRAPKARRVQPGGHHRQARRRPGHHPIACSNGMRHISSAVHQRHLNRRRPGAVVTDLDERRSPAPSAGSAVSAGRPSSAGSTRSAAARACSRASACSGARGQTVASAPIAARPAALRRRPGPSPVSASGSSSKGAPSSAADALAARTEAAAAVRRPSGPIRRVTAQRLSTADLTSSTARDHVGRRPAHRPTLRVRHRRTIRPGFARSPGRTGVALPTGAADTFGHRQPPVAGHGAGQHGVATERTSLPDTAPDAQRCEQLPQRSCRPTADQ